MRALAPRRAPRARTTLVRAAAAATLFVLSCSGAPRAADAAAGAPAPACPDASGVDYASLAAQCTSDEGSAGGSGAGMSAAACAKCVDALGVELVPLFVRTRPCALLRLRMRAACRSRAAPRSHHARTLSPKTASRRCASSLHAPRRRS
jgi:hypothetical protein